MIKRIINRKITHTLGCATVAVSALTLMPMMAQGLELQTGKWGFKSATLTPMSPQPVEEYTEQCIEDSDFDPLEEMMAAMNQQCEVTVNEDTSSKLDVSLSCTVPNAGAMTGDLVFNVDGPEANGEMEMNVNMGGQAMLITNTWKGEYLGACD